MGEGQEVKTRDSPRVDIQERGEIFFFYRPKVNKDSAHNLDDVQRTYVVLRPESGGNAVEQKQSASTGKEGGFKASKAQGKDDHEIGAVKDNAGSDERVAEDEIRSGDARKDEAEKNTTSRNPDEETDDGAKSDVEKKDQDEGLEDSERKDTSEPGEGSEKVDVSKQTLLRLLVLGRKSLPDASKRTRPYWGYVELVTTDVDDIKKSLAAETYETKTRGQREKPACRPVGEGVYRIVRHPDGRRVHTHLLYKLELPCPSSHHEPQEVMNIEPEGSYIIQIKNPERGNPPRQGLPYKRKSAFPASLQGKLGSYSFCPADPPDFLNYEGCEFILISASDDIDEELGLDVKAEEVGNVQHSDLLDLFGEPKEGNSKLIKPLVEGEWS